MITTLYEAGMWMKLLQTKTNGIVNDTERNEAIQDCVEIVNKLISSEIDQIVFAFNKGMIPEPYNEYFDGKDYYSKTFTTK